MIDAEPNCEYDVKWLWLDILWVVCPFLKDLAVYAKTQKFGLKR